MSNPSSKKPTFIEQAEALILENLANEQFGVSELGGSYEHEPIQPAPEDQETDTAFCKPVYTSSPS